MGEFELPGCHCILFDCAWFNNKIRKYTRRTRTASRFEAIRNAMVVVFCVDFKKRLGLKILRYNRLINPAHLIAIATKTDLLSEKGTANGFHN